jgi:hypothetical protein
MGVLRVGNRAVLADGILEDDGAELRIAFIFLRSSLARQFAFVQQVWMNDRDFVGPGDEKDRSHDDLRQPRCEQKQRGWWRGICDEQLRADVEAGGSHWALVDRWTGRQ